MKNLIIAASLACIASASHADVPTQYDYNPSVFAGFTWSFNGTTGGTPGISLKVLSTNQPDVAAAAAGVTYNFDGSFGCDAGLGFNNGDLSATLTYDFCLRGFQFGLGKALTDPKLVDDI